MAIGAGSLRLANSGDGTITRVNLAEGKVVAEITASENFRWEPNTSTPRSVAASGERAWFPDRTGRGVSRSDPHTNRRLARPPVPRPPGEARRAHRPHHHPRRRACTRTRGHFRLRHRHRRGRSVDHLPRGWS